MEWSVNVHSPIFAVSRCWYRFGFINIEDSPLLLYIIILSDSSNLSVFRINTTLNFKDCSSFVDNPPFLVFEELIPSWISFICISISSSNIQWKIRESNRFDGLRNLIKSPHLFFLVVFSCLDYKILATIYWDNSIEP